MSEIMSIYNIYNSLTMMCMFGLCPLSQFELVKMFQSSTFKNIEKQNLD